MLITPALVLFLGCENTTKTPGETADDTGVVASGELPGERLAGTTARETSPSTENVGALGSANADFSLRLLNRVRGMSQGNVVLSPWSLQLVMSQVYAGADGEAKTAIKDTFGWTLDEPALHEAFDAADLMIQEHNDPDGDPPVAITSTNQIFVTDGYTIGEDWLNTLSEFYGTGVQQLDFLADPGGVSDAINAWISARTAGHIDDLITSEMVAGSRLLLVNALYFKASWYVPFTESSTADLPYYLVDGTPVEVSTMQGYVRVDGAFADGFTVADIPYSDTGLSMTLIVPDAGRFEEIASSLTWEQLSAAIDDEEGCDECNVQLPKFKIEGQPPVQQALEDMGMDAAFGGSYPGISDLLTLTGVDQAGFVEVNEKGTEAAAATVAEFSDSASVPPFDELIVDRPFLWMVRDGRTQNVLFAGVVMDPR